MLMHTHTVGHEAKAKVPTNEPLGFNHRSIAKRRRDDGSATSRYELHDSREHDSQAGHSLDGLNECMARGSYYQ